MLDSKHGYRPVTRENVTRTRQWRLLSPALREAVEVVSTVFPFRTNAYVMDELIDWSRVPDDPFYQLTFGQKDMLAPEHYARMAYLIDTGASKADLNRAANEIRLSLNPHPAGQMTHNVPTLRGRALSGLQHKYRETVLFFPSAGQTCHAYCTFCFRWPQFVSLEDHRFEAREGSDLFAYLRAHPEVSDLLVTGGDPLVMNSRRLRRYLEPLIGPESGLEHLRTVRLGTKSVAYWPQRFVDDADADELLRLFEQIVAGGRHLAIMAHYSHARELSTPVAREAIRRIRNTGAQIRMQSPLIRHVNDNPDVWAEMWSEGVNLGLVPYYMFVERDTGPKPYFELPLVQAWEIFRQAYQQVSGLARTVRGPSMSALPGKVQIDGVVEIGGKKHFALQFLQARNPDWVRRPFFAEFDPKATWLSDLEPAFGEPGFFYELEDPQLAPEPRRQALEVLDWEFS